MRSHCGLCLPDLAEQARHLPDHGVLQVVAVEIGIEREIGIIANARGQVPGLGERSDNQRASVLALRSIRPKLAKR